MERERRQRWTIQIIESRRVDGKAKKTATHIATVSCWDIVDESRWQDYIDPVFTVTYPEYAWSRIEKLFPNENDYVKAREVINKKFQPIVDAVLDEYAKSEEHKIFLENQKKKDAQKKIEAARQKKEKRLQEENERKQEEYRRKSQEEFKKAFDGTWSKFGSTSLQGTFNTTNEKAMVQELLKDGDKSIKSVLGGN